MGNITPDYIHARDVKQATTQPSKSVQQFENLLKYLFPYVMNLVKEEQMMVALVADVIVREEGDGLSYVILVQVYVLLGLNWEVHLCSSMERRRETAAAFPPSTK